MRGESAVVPPLYLVFWAVLLFAVGFAMWKGGAPERLTAAVLVAMTLVQVTAHRVIPLRFDEVDVPAMIVDLWAAVGLTVIALYADRTWPLWTAALQLLSSMSHLIRISSDEIEMLVYGWVKSLPTFGVLLILILGTTLHRRRIRQHGSDRSWRMSLPPPHWMRLIERYLRR